LNLNLIENISISLSSNLNGYYGFQFFEMVPEDALPIQLNSKKFSHSRVSLSSNSKDHPDHLVHLVFSWASSTQCWLSSFMCVFNIGNILRCLWRFLVHEKEAATSPILLITRDNNTKAAFCRSVGCGRNFVTATQCRSHELTVHILGAVPFTSLSPQREGGLGKAKQPEDREKMTDSAVHSDESGESSSKRSLTPTVLV